MFIHVVEQVQLFKLEQSVLITSPTGSEIVRGDEVVPMKRTILTWLINSEGLRTKKCSKFTFGSDGEVWCAAYIRAVSLCYFSPLPVFWWMHMQSFESGYKQQKSEAMWSCAGMHRHMNTHALHCDVLPDTHVYYHGWCWGKGLVAGQRSRRWDFMANTGIEPLVRERGLSEVQKQREAQMDTLDKQRAITREDIRQKREIVC